MSKRAVLISVSLVLFTAAGVLLYLQLRPRAPRTGDDSSVREADPSAVDRPGGPRMLPEDD